MKIGLAQQTSKPHRNYMCGALSLIIVKVRNTQAQANNANYANVIIKACYNESRIMHE